MTISVTIIYGKTKSDFRLIVNGKRVFDVFDNNEYNKNMLLRYGLPAKQIKAFNGDIYRNTALHSTVICYHISYNVCLDKSIHEIIIKAKNLESSLPLWTNKKSFSFIAEI